jgi:hypothetical protein
MNPQDGHEGGTRLRAAASDKTALSFSVDTEIRSVVKLT